MQQILDFSVIILTTILIGVIVFLVSAAIGAMIFKRTKWFTPVKPFKELSRDSKPSEVKRIIEK